MHAIVVHVSIKQGRDGDTASELENVLVPTAKAAPGFQGAYWARELGRQCGIAIELFDTKEHAEEELGRRADGPPPDASVTVDSASVFEVLASA